MGMGCNRNASSYHRGVVVSPLPVMPFKSEKQRRYLWANKPKVAKKFAEDSKKEHWLKRKWR